MVNKFIMLLGITGLLAGCQYGSPSPSPSPTTTANRPAETSTPPAHLQIYPYQPGEIRQQSLQLPSLPVTDTADIHPTAP